jgi:hypothetical protein
LGGEFVALVLIAAALLAAVLMTAPRGRHNNSDATKHAPSQTSAEFSDLIDAIRSEGRALRKEEEREDDRRSVIDSISTAVLIATLGVLAYTCWAIIQQVEEMKKVYGPIAQQAAASAKQAETAAADAVANQRAWIGPTAANIAEEPVIGRPIKVNVVYINSGRTPAPLSNLIYTHSFSKLEWDGMSACVSLRDFQKRCISTPFTSAITVAWPTVGQNNYTENYPSSNNSDPKPVVMDHDIQSGSEVVATIGCYVYRTRSLTHHTSLCYFATPGNVHAGPLNICPCGNDAD